jgi:uncharacterized protein (DUF488 family)
MELHTIGHSNHPIGKFILLLNDHGIGRLVDVRTTPYSRHNPQFNKENLQHVLVGRDIEYVYAGTNLGGRPCDPSCYIHNRIPTKVTNYLYEVNYPEVMKRPWFIEGILGLLELASQRTTAIMCSEEDPALCHRHHLIARYLMDEYPEVRILHIRGDSSVINAKSIHSAVDTTDAEQLSF